MTRELRIGLFWLVAYGCITPLKGICDDVVRSYGTYAYIVKVEADGGVHSLRSAAQRHPLYMVYRGQLMILDSHVAILKRKRMHFVFSMVITPDLAYTMQGGGGMALKQDEPVRWFDITFAWNGTGWSCIIDELPRDKMATLLPDHAMVLLYDPALVKGVRQPVCVCYCRDAAYDGGCCTFELPTIEFAGSEAEHAEARMRVEAALPGIRACNRQASSVVQVVDSGYCALHSDESAPCR